VIDGDSMDHILPISAARGKLHELIKKISQTGKRLVVTRRGKAEAVVLPTEEL
jgi:prevent-host-death family protein